MTFLTFLMILRSLILKMKCAEKIVVDYIVTENLKDFALSKIPAIDTASALRKVFG